MIVLGAQLVETLRRNRGAGAVSHHAVIRTHGGEITIALTPAEYTSAEHALQTRAPLVVRVDLESAEAS